MFFTFVFTVVSLCIPVYSLCDFTVLSLVFHCFFSLLFHCLCFVFFAFYLFFFTVSSVWFHLCFQKLCNSKKPWRYSLANSCETMVPDAFFSQQQWHKRWNYSEETVNIETNSETTLEERWTDNETTVNHQRKNNETSEKQWNEPTVMKK